METIYNFFAVVGVLATFATIVCASYILFSEYADRQSKKILAENLRTTGENKTTKGEKQ